MAEIVVTEKPCSRCEETKPLHAFSRQKLGRYGRRADCKECQRVYNSAWKRDNPEKVVAAREARYERKRDDILAYNREWNRTHSDALNAASRRYRARLNGGVESLPSGRRRRSTTTLADVKEQKRAWRLANPDKVAASKRAHYERHRDKVIQNVERWRRENPDLRRAQSHARRARQAAAAGADYTTAEMIAARVAFYGGRCRYCSGPFEAIDHRIPLARGGAHWPANLVPCCISCNSRKNAKTEREFMALLEREGVMQHHG